MTAAGWMLFSVVFLAAGGVACLAAGRKGLLANRVGPVIGLLGGIPSVGSAGWVLAAGRESSLNFPWGLPVGSFHLAVDGLSAFFALAIATVCMVCAGYGGAYLRGYGGRKNLGAAWCFYHLLFAAMLLVVTACDAVLFLMAWEGMALASFFLVMFEHEKPEVRRAGWTYLVAAHLGTACLLAMFVLLGLQNGTLDFDGLASPAGSAAGAVFLLAVAGFGTKAGFLPLHVWLPEAHPVAPSHVSAVMSGVMIKTGLYGLLRTLTFLGPPPAWWGWTLLGIGIVSGVGGVLLALGQHNLKRLLAYSSVENIGIICLGLGLWLLGRSAGNPAVAAPGLLGGLLHVWNHAIFKSLLFLGAGAVAHATGTLNLEALGGLWKRMKYTGLLFLIGAIAICGLPPLNGFVSEFSLYLASFRSLAEGTSALPLATAGGMTVLALAIIGGLAAACFTKVFGIVFLGEPRSPLARDAHEAPVAMRAAMAIPAGLCVWIGLLGPLAAAATARAMETSPVLGDGTMAPLSPILWRVSLAGAGLAVLSLLAAGIRRRLLAKRPVREGPTWDCGYAAPTARMQYTASGFAWPILHMFRRLLLLRTSCQPPSGLFPEKASFESHAEDVFYRFVFTPLFRAVAWLGERLRWFQQGRNHLYVLYIALTLLILLLWNMTT